MKVDGLSTAAVRSFEPQITAPLADFTTKLVSVSNAAWQYLSGKGPTPTALVYPEELDSFAKEKCPDLQIHSWRREDRLSARDSTPNGQFGSERRSMAQVVIDTAKLAVDDLRDEHDSCLSKGDHALNRLGFYARNTSPVLFRVDSRLPSELAENNGFGSSRGVDGIDPMLLKPVLITSASLRASEKVLEDWSMALPSHQYSIDSAGAEAASWADNFKYLDDIPDDHGEDFRLDYDEAHVDAEQINASQVFILDSSDPAVKARIALMILEGERSPHGVSVYDFAAHESRIPEVSAGMINKAFIDQMD